MTKQNKKINVLIHELGSISQGLIRKFKTSELLDNIYIISNKEYHDDDYIFLGSPSTIKFGELKKHIKEKHIDFIIDFNESHSLLGLIDYYHNEIKIPTIGTTKKWFSLESSKTKGKDFMLRNDILTPDYMVIDDEKKLDEAISAFGFPIVVKNNFLQAGFGSYICNDKKSAYKCFKKISKEKQTCIAEKFVSGKELSLQYLWDGNTLLPLLPVKDFKKNTDDKNGINTGGLGSYTPVLLTKEKEFLINEYNKKLSIIFKREKVDFTGVFTSNILFSDNKIYTLEFNMRPGITEFETLIEHVKSDFLEVMKNCALKELENSTINYKDGITGCIALSHKDYLQQKKISKKNIKLRKHIAPVDNDIRLNFNSFFSKENKLNVSLNKRFLSIISTDRRDPFKKIYRYINTIDSKEIYYRKDIKYEKQFI